jgi:predicted TIM-barrel fold metal-dependent hydrolase
LVGTALRIIGGSRCMFATRFPVDRLLWSFEDLVRACAAITADLMPEQRDGFSQPARHA